MIGIINLNLLPGRNMWAYLLKWLQHLRMNHFCCKYFLENYALTSWQLDLNCSLLMKMTWTMWKLYLKYIPPMSPLSHLPSCPMNHIDWTWFSLDSPGLITSKVLTNSFPKFKWDKNICNFPGFSPPSPCKHKYYFFPSPIPGGLSVMYEFSKIISNSRNIISTVS